MASFVVEVGITSGEGDFKQWDSEGFYAGYEPNGGPMILKGSWEEAFRFPTHERASRIPNGDPRLRERHRIVPAPGEPNV